MQKRMLMKRRPWTVADLLSNRLASQSRASSQPCMCRPNDVDSLCSCSNLVGLVHHPQFPRTWCLPSLASLITSDKAHGLQVENAFAECPPYNFPTCLPVPKRSHSAWPGTEIGTGVPTGHLPLLICPFIWLFMPHAHNGHPPLHTQGS